MCKLFRYLLAFAAIVCFAEGTHAQEYKGRADYVAGSEQANTGNLPPVGRSLFDYLVTGGASTSKVYDLPVPFSALIKKLNAQVQNGAGNGPAVKTVLIPLGRSLQRNAAAPQFFKYPRVVVMTDAQPRVDARSAGALFKDRLYLGFQEKTNIIEVISYNEAAGRFEFQVVRNYRSGDKPQVLYANRTLCTACHQNEGPIFSRQVWDETNANPMVTALLRSEHRDFYGIKLGGGVDIPYAIDNATDRANLFATYQALWRDACEIAASKEQTINCRAALLTAALQYRLSGGQAFDETAASYASVVAALGKGARERWPRGIPIPNADLPNRNPLSNLAMDAGATSPASLIAASNVAADFDPLNPRSPSDTWSVSDARLLSRRLVMGLAEFISESDMRLIDAQLLSLAERSKPERVEREGSCEVVNQQTTANGKRIDFNCSGAADAGLITQGSFYVSGTTITRGSLDRLGVAGQGGSELRDLDIVGGKVVTVAKDTTATLLVRRGGTRARTPDGNAIDSVRLTWSARPMSIENKSPQAKMVVTVIKDFAPLRSAINAMMRDTVSGKSDVFARQPFRRAAIMPALLASLGAKPGSWCCLDDKDMPPAVTESNEGAPAQTITGLPAAQPFFQYCAECHQSDDRFPPNFLHGDAKAVAAQLAYCAPRLYVRLSMWQLGAAQRPKTPMPPEVALTGLHLSADTWRNSGELAALRSYIGDILKAQDKKIRLDALLTTQYESLRACLPDATRADAN